VVLPCSSIVASSTVASSVVGRGSSPTSTPQPHGRFLLAPVSSAVRDVLGTVLRSTAGATPPGDPELCPATCARRPVPVFRRHGMAHPRASGPVRVVDVCGIRHLLPLLFPEIRFFRAQPGDHCSDGSAARPADRTGETGTPRPSLRRRVDWRFDWRVGPPDSRTSGCLKSPAGQGKPEAFTRWSIESESPEMLRTDLKRTGS